MPAWQTPERQASMHCWGALNAGRCSPSRAVQLGNHQHSSWPPAHNGAISTAAPSGGSRLHFDRATSPRPNTQPFSQFNQSLRHISLQVGWQKRRAWSAGACSASCAAVARNWAASTGPEASSRAKKAAAALSGRGSACHPSAPGHAAGLLAKTFMKVSEATQYLVPPPSSESSSPWSEAEVQACAIPSVWASVSGSEHAGTQCMTWLMMMIFIFNVVGHVLTRFPGPGGA